MGNPVFEAVRTALAVRVYKDREVPGEVVSRIVEAARLTASSMNAQPWHFVVIRDRERLRRVGDLAPTGRYIADAALAIVVAYRRGNKFGVADCSRAIQSMILTAWAEGVGSNWVGFGTSRGVPEEVGLPDDYEMLAVIPFGYPARPVGKGRKKRKSLDEVVSAERFGQPLR